MAKGKLDNFKNQCAGKIAHATLSSAEYIMGRMKVGVGEFLEIYKCKYCKKFHIGHTPGTKHTLSKKKEFIKKKIKYNLIEE